MGYLLCLSMFAQESKNLIPTPPYSSLHGHIFQVHIILIGFQLIIFTLEKMQLYRLLKHEHFISKDFKNNLVPRITTYDTAHASSAPNLYANCKVCFNITPFVLLGKSSKTELIFFIKCFFHKWPIRYYLHNQMISIGLSVTPYTLASVSNGPCLRRLIQ